jgi:hypothetical protein
MENLTMFDKQYPNLAAWILGGDAWIELGQGEMSHSYVRLLDIGGLIWESKRSYQTVAEALTDAEEALAAWMNEHG